MEWIRSNLQRYVGKTYAYSKIKAHSENEKTTKSVYFPKTTKAWKTWFLRQTSKIVALKLLVLCVFVYLFYTIYTYYTRHVILAKCLERIPSDKKDWALIGTFKDGDFPWSPSPNSLDSSEWPDFETDGLNLHCLAVNDPVCHPIVDAAIWNVPNFWLPAHKIASAVEVELGWWHRAAASAKTPHLWFGTSMETLVSGFRPFRFAGLIELFDWTSLMGVGRAHGDSNFPSNELSVDGVNIGINPESLKQYSFPFQRPSQPIKELFDKKKLSAPILYIERDDFVKHLMEWVDVDSVGKCEHNKDFPSNLKYLEYDKKTGKSLREMWGSYTNAAERLLERYKFRVVIPNSLCDDYVTEKLTLCFEYGVVPIYMGTPNSHDWDPGLAAGVHPAMIHISDYDSMEKLAEYIIELTIDDEKYLRFFEFLAVDKVLYPSHGNKVFAATHRWGGENLDDINNNMNEPLDIVVGKIRNWESFVCAKTLEMIKNHSSQYNQLEKDELHGGSFKIRKRETNEIYGRLANEALVLASKTGCHGSWRELLTFLGKDFTKFVVAPPAGWLNIFTQKLIRQNHGDEI